jgi:hypothetical protein
MHWNETKGGYHEALRRLAVVMLTLAAISDGLSGRSPAVRRFVFWLLRRAETLARGFATTASALPLMPVARFACHSGDREEAARLARTFRALATVFFALSRQATHRLRGSCSSDQVRLSGDWRNGEWAGGRGVVRRRSYVDTS